MTEATPAAHLGRAIHLRRVELGLKRRDLAIAAKLSYPYVSEIENGHKEPSAKALRQLAEALRLTPIELVALTERVGDVDTSSLLLDQEAPTRHLPSLSSRSTGYLTDAPPLAFDSVASGPSSDELRRAVRAEIGDWLERELPRLVRDAVSAELDRRERR